MHRAAAVAIGHAASDLEREPRLPHAAGPDEREQPHARLGEDAGDLRQLGVAADQLVGRGGQGGGRRAARLLGRQLRVVREDRLLEPPQLRPRLDPELVDEQPAPLAHHLERLRLPAAAVEREHQVRAHALAQRVLGHQRPQLADQVGVAAARELRAHPLLDRLHPQLLQPRDLALREVVEAVVGERRPAPQLERGLQVGGGRVRVLGPRALEQVLEAVRVDRAALHAERVPGRAAVDGRRLAEPVAQARHLLLQRLHAVARRPPRPYGLDQLVDRDRLRGAQRQRGEQGALLGAVELDGVPLDAHVERAEEPDLDVRAHLVSER